ncbi:hypothetical protein C8J57DRAFT_1074030 [Mycena rebaudengoi]|nr:hypothetical protein C8J57DRAFT_1074030 [Mycena rebaudengoi]
MPTALHLYCLHHLDGNVTKQLRLTLAGDWDPFRRQFWDVYRAVSPAEFDRLWQLLLERYPTAKEYLSNELYPCRQRWAWTWIGDVFTAGIQTSGRVESENRVNRNIGGPKKTLTQLFDGLNERTNEQTAQDLIRQRQIITQLREYAGPYANEKCRREMEESVFYTVEVVQLPPGTRNWRHMLNPFENDRAYISCKWLIQLVRQKGLQVRQLIRVIHRATGCAHYVALLRDGRYVCDCCMERNLGLVCRHFFSGWVNIRDLEFHLSFIRAR